MCHSQPGMSQYAFQCDSFTSGEHVGSFIGVTMKLRMIAAAFLVIAGDGRCECVGVMFSNMSVQWMFWTNWVCRLGIGVIVRFWTSVKICCDSFDISDVVLMFV